MSILLDGLPGASTAEVARMSTALDQVRDKIHTVEVALRDSGSTTPCVSSRVEDAGIQLAHRAIIDCLKSIAEALEQIERRSTHQESLR